MRWRIAVALVLSPFVSGRGVAQGSLAEVAERVRQAWLVHDVQGVVGQSSSVVLQIPGADPSAPVDRAQAIELLRRHLRAGAERGCASAPSGKWSRGAGTRNWTGATWSPAPAMNAARRSFWGFESRPEWMLTELRSAP